MNTLVIAYGIVWLAAVGYIVRLRLAQRQLNARLADLEDRLEPLVHEKRPRSKAA